MKDLILNSLFPILIKKVVVWAIYTKKCSKKQVICSNQPNTKLNVYIELLKFVQAPNIC